MGARGGGGGGAQAQSLHHLLSGVCAPGRESPDPPMDCFERGGGERGGGGGGGGGGGALPDHQLLILIPVLVLPGQTGLLPHLFA